MENPSDDGRVKGAETLMKALDIIEFVANADAPPKIAVIARQLGISRPTAHRIAGALVHRAYLRQDAETQGFRLGHKLFELSYARWNELDLAGAAGEVLEGLRDLTGETVVLAIRARQSILIVDRRESAHAMRPAIRVGQIEPLEQSLLGLAVLAFMRPKDRQEYLAQIGAHAQDLALSLRLWAARGYVTQVSEFDETLSGIAMPIRDFLGDPFATLAVVGPSRRLSAEVLHRLAPSVIEAARAITRNTGNPVQSIAPRPRPTQPVTPDIAVLTDVKCLLGESPIWDAQRGRLNWIDIFGPTVHAFDPASGRHVQARCSDLPGALCLCEDGSLVIAQRDGLYRLSADDLRPTEMLLNTGVQMQGQRFNDGAVSPDGALFLGTMDLGVAEDEGGIVRFDIASHALARVMSGLTLPNGISWTQDGTRLYLCDSRRQSIYEFARDPDTGYLGPRRLFAQIPKEAGMPDGMAVDAEGCLWVALWDGWSIARFDEAGKLVRKYVVPVPRPTSLCFGGSDMRTLFVTSASVRLTPEQVGQAPESGAVLYFSPGAAGFSSRRLRTQ